MTNFIILEKTINLENIKDLINVSIDEDISYLKRCEGVFCSGFISINGMFLNEMEQEKRFHELVELDNLIPYDNIVSLEDFRIEVEDFEYHLKEEELKMIIKLKINSFKEIDTTFPTEDYQEDFLEENDMEVEEQRENKMPFLSYLLDTKKYQKAATFYVYKNNQSLEQISNKYNISLEELKQNNKEVFQEGDLINIPIRHE